MTETEKDVLNKRLIEIEKQLNRILFILQSDDSTNSKGLVEKVGDIRLDFYKLVEELKIQKAKRNIWAAVAGGIGAAILWLIKLLITKNI